VPAFPALSLGRCWGKPMQAVEATVSVFDQMTDDEQKMLLAALAALRRDWRSVLTT
jgi:hypothetical protein